MAKDVLDIAMYLIVAALVVLIVMNASKFATAVQGVTAGTNNILTTLTGSGYKAAA